MDLALILNNLVKKSHRLKTLISGNYLASQYDSILVDSRTNSFTITLPDDPIIGSRIMIFDVGGALSSHAVTLDANSSVINGQSSIDLKSDNYFFEVVYYNMTMGWRLVASPASDGDGISEGDSGFGCCEPLVDNTPELIFDQTGDLVSTII